MKKSVLAIALLLTFGSVGAQTPGSATPTVKRDETTLQPAAVDSMPSGASINPFTGKTLQLEQVQRELEVYRLRTQLLEEQLKQTTIKAETDTIPLRKAVEAAQANTGVKKEIANLAAIEDNLAQMKAAKVKPAVKLASRDEATLRVEIEAKLRAEQAMSASRALAQPQNRQPTLLSVMEVSGARSAVLDFEGATLVVSEGEMTPAGVLHVKDSESAEIGGRPYRVHSATISRFVVSDAKPVAAKALETKQPSLPTSSLAAATKSTPAPAFQLPLGLPPLPSATTTP